MGERSELSVYQAPETSSVVMPADTLINMELFLFWAIINNAAVNSLEGLSWYTSSVLLQGPFLGTELLDQRLFLCPTL